MLSFRTMPVKVVEEDFQKFMGNCESYVQKHVNFNENVYRMNQTRKLTNYLHNVILRRTGIESNVHRFGSRMIGCATKSSDLDIFVEAGKIFFYENGEIIF